MTDYKAGVRRAMENFINKQSKPTAPTPARTAHGKPEKAVERDCVIWLKDAGFDGQVYESKAQLVNGVWRNAGMKFGTCDWQGVTPIGMAAFIEFKAPGKRKSFWRDGNERQVDYLLSKISLGAFAVVIDDEDDLAVTYKEWFRLWSISRHDAKEFLMRHLPEKPKRASADAGPLFD